MNTRYNSALDNPRQRDSRYEASQSTAEKMMEEASEYREKGDIKTACALAQRASMIIRTTAPSTSPIANKYRRQANEVCRGASKA